MARRCSSEISPSPDSSYRQDTFHRCTMSTRESWLSFLPQVRCTSVIKDLLGKAQEEWGKTAVGVLERTETVTPNQDTFGTAFMFCLLAFHQITVKPGNITCIFDCGPEEIPPEKTFHSQITMLKNDPPPPGTRPAWTP